MRLVPSLERLSRALPEPSQRRRRSRGQSLVELALVAPVLLLIVLAGVDFGRVYLGYINLQQMARVAADFAANNAKAWDATPDTAVQARYQELIANDARAINCILPADGSGNQNVPGPVFAGGFDLGDPVEVRLTCEFDIATPILENVFGGGIIEVGAGAVFPIKEGAVSSVPGGGGGTIAPPIVSFDASPTSGFGPLEVTVVDTSLNGPTSWSWQFDPGSASTRGPHTRTYDCATGSAPGTTCTFHPWLRVGNSGGFATSPATEITVTVPPATGPIAEFEAEDRTGQDQLTTDFDFIDVRGGTVTYTNWEWDFDGNGTFDDTGENVTHTYNAVGTYDVTLRVTDDAGNTNSQTKTDYIVVTEKLCTVPDFIGVRRNAAQDLWADAGFTTSVTAVGQGNFRIGNQSLLGGTINPQPDGCASTITVQP